MIIATSAAHSSGQTQFQDNLTKGAKGTEPSFSAF